MKNCSVFVIWTNPLFLESIRAVLGHPSIQLVGDSSDFPQAQAEIAAHQPDIVIIEGNADGATIDIETLPILISTTRVFQMSLNDNELVLCHHEHHTLVNTDDLLTLILEEGDMK
jgi:DNA-binding NarL/FixJ family response regulator